MRMLTSHVTHLSPSNKASQKLLVRVNHKLPFVQSQTCTSRKWVAIYIYICTTYWGMFRPGENS